MALTTFWLPAAAITLGVAGLVVLGLLRGARLREGAEPDDRRAVRIYADQLREIERDQARGLIPEEEAARLRTEVSRRVLEADRARREPAGQAPAAARIAGLALVPLSVALGAWIYWQTGAPLYPDQPLVQRHAEAAAARAARPGQADLEARWLASPERPRPADPDPEFAALMDQLRTALAGRPLDLRGFQLLARNEANLGNHAEAAAAGAQVIALLGAEATPTDHVFLAEQMILAAGGIVSPEAEAVLETVLRRDPANGPARYFTGLMFAQTGRPDLTFRLWRSLLEDSPPDAPWVAHIRATIEDLALIAGVRYSLPPPSAQGARGPSDADIAAAMGLSEGERTEMIGAMVEGLAMRLASQGGNAGDWARLISALGVLDQTERARAIWAEARLVFADQPDQLQLIDQAGRGLGFGE